MLLFRISPAANLPPADISFLSVFPKESEWIYPPGLILENRLAWKDNLGETDDGEKVECTIVEALPSMQRREDAKKKGTRDATEATPA